MKDVKRLFVRPDTLFRDVLTRINVAARGVALVVDDEGALVGIVTDGDTRRAVCSRRKRVRSQLPLRRQRQSKNSQRS